jgi:hypothetical protein
MAVAEKKSTPEEAPASASAVVAESTVAAGSTAQAEFAPQAPAKRKGKGLAVAGIVVGSVLVAGALFGGGVLVGTHLNEFDSGMNETLDGHPPLPGLGNRPGPDAGGNNQDAGGNNQDDGGNHTDLDGDGN